VSLGVPVSQLEILAGRINALLNVLGMLSMCVGVVCGLGWVVMAVDSARHGDWTILLALVFFVGCLLLGSILEPLIPYGRTLLPFVMGALGLGVAYWLIVYH
jgi:hypothetical protein